MKTNSLLVLFLSFLLVHIHFSFAKRGGGGFGKSFGFKKSPTSNRGSTHTNSNTGQKSGQGSSSQGGYPKQPGQSSPGGYPSQSGRPGQPGSYPQQHGGGYHKRYPAHGSPYEGYGSQSYWRYGGYGGQGGYGGYPGGYINQNPNNKILSPHYGGSFGYGGYGAGGGSPFSHSVQSMGMYPSDKSRGFGRSAVMAAAGGAMAGMALGYGIGRFPRPHFGFHSPQEEYYYNHYMYRKYGVKSTDTNDYSRDYSYTQPSETYDSYMDSCMKRPDLLSVGSQNANNKADGVTTNTVVTSGPETGSKINSTGAENSSEVSTSHPVIQPDVKPVRLSSQAEDDDTVSIVEIGYPALIEQLKARRCLELYMVYSEKYMKREAGGAHGLQMSWQGTLAVVTSTVLMLLNSNMLMLLH